MNHDKYPLTSSFIPPCKDGSELIGAVFVDARGSYSYVIIISYLSIRSMAINGIID